MSSSSAHVYVAINNQRQQIAMELYCCFTDRSTAYLEKERLQSWVLRTFNSQTTKTGQGTGLALTTLFECAHIPCHVARNVFVVGVPGS